MDNNNKLSQGLLKADGIDPAGVSEAERAVFREMLGREKKRMKRLSRLSVGAMWIFALAMLGLCVSENILEALHIPFVVAWFGLMVVVLAIIIRYGPRHNRMIKQSNMKISKLHYLVHGRHRGLILIGKKDGKRYIYWPRIIMIAAALWLFVSLSGTGVYYLLCQRWISLASPISHIIFCTVMSLSFVIFILREGLKTPLDELVEVKAKSKQSIPASSIRPEERDLIGINIENWPTLKVVSGMPAEKAGIEDGDVVLKVDGNSISHIESPSDAQNLLFGKAGEKVVLAVKRGEQILAIEIERAPLPK